MKAACIQAVSEALGRPATATETRDIETRISRAMRHLGEADPEAWAAKSFNDQVREAGVHAAAELVHEKVLKQKRQALSILAHGRIMQHVLESKARGIDGIDALSRTAVFIADGKSNFLSVESRAKAIERDSLRKMLGTIEAAHPKFLGMIANKEVERQIEMELFGEDSGNADARAGVKEFQSVAEGLKQAKNAAGGDVGTLEDWGRPHDHSQMLVAKAGKDQWIADVLPKVNRKRYVNEDGTRMNDAQLTDFLDHVWTTIATNGANKVDPGQFQGSGSRANRGSAHREVHFKDSQSFIEYKNKYGEKSLYESLVGHIASTAKDVALAEVYGPNADATFRYFKEALTKEAKLADPTRNGEIDTEAMRAQSRYDEASGKTQPVGSAHMAKAFDTLRSWLIAARLGSSFVTSFSDNATLHLTGHINNLPEMRLLANQLATLNPLNRAEERRAQLQGLSLNTVLANLNRFGQDALGSSFSKSLSNAVLRASFLNAATEAKKRAFGVTMYGTIGDQVRQHADISKLDANDWRILRSKGITDTDWQVWRKAKLEDWGGGNDTMLTPESIYRIPDADLEEMGNPQHIKREAAIKLLGAVLEETDVAVVEPGANERAQMRSGLARGTLKGEFAKSFFLFKSFPLAMIERHIVRGMSMRTGTGRTAYIAALLAGTTVLGMTSLQLDQVMTGKDPRDMNPFDKGGLRNWLAAMLKGGSLGIYGDLLFSDSTQYGNSPIATLAGPIAGLGEDVLKMTQGNIVKVAQGQPTHVGADLVKFTRSNTPGASLWYAKAALDHLIFQRLQEYFSPGYLATVRSRTQQQFGQNYWWNPGETTPDRAPDLGAAAGN